MVYALPAADLFLIADLSWLYPVQISVGSYSCWTIWNLLSVWPCQLPPVWYCSIDKSKELGIIIFWPNSGCIQIRCIHCKGILKATASLSRFNSLAGRIYNLCCIMEMEKSVTFSFLQPAWSKKKKIYPCIAALQKSCSALYLCVEGNILIVELWSCSWELSCPWSPQLKYYKSSRSCRKKIK